MTEYRNLGRTGVKVSPLCLGTMMFGARGNTDHADSVRIIHHALDSGINFVDTADVYSAGSPRPSSARHWPAGGVTTSCSPPSSTEASAATPTSRATAAVGSSVRWRTACGGLAPILDRPLPGAPS